MKKKLTNNIIIVISLFVLLMLYPFVLILSYIGEFVNEHKR
nr:MAG TPA: hypothetical protein [Caudoviricetes sp.]